MTATFLDVRPSGCQLRPEIFGSIWDETISRPLHDARRGAVVDFEKVRWRRGIIRRRWIRTSPTLARWGRKVRNARRSLKRRRDNVARGYRSFIASVAAKRFKNCVILNTGFKCVESQSKVFQNLDVHLKIVLLNQHHYQQTI